MEERHHPGHRPDGDHEGVLDHVEDALHDFDEQHHVLRTADDGDRFRWRARIRRNPHALFWYRIAVAIAGLLLMVAAALTGWLPGPGGIPLFLLGLAVWSSEFAWAKRLMTVFSRLFNRFTRMSRRSKRRIVFGALAGAVLAWYLTALVTGLPGWLPGPVSRLLDRLPGLYPTSAPS